MVGPIMICSAVRATHWLIFRAQVACLNGTDLPSEAVIDRIGRVWQSTPSLAAVP